MTNPLKPREKELIIHYMSSDFQEVLFPLPLPADASILCCVSVVVGNTMYVASFKECAE